ncbi:S1 family peptidase [Gordonia alkaliphila]|uniref:S1 family peptidase n=1 Tax=Gordonia alkaliphila TaxID=1053547 RepID=UPI001FF3BF64|nr:S1 family peptidase [Gordonia alkaliphila]MCK0441107.1 S1 family peptidase [Gordonia alkaliphila]
MKNLIAAVAISVMALFASVSAPAHASGGMVAGVDLSNSLVAMPGAQWWAQKSGGACSIGWIVNDGSANYAFTAGHCADAGDVAFLGNASRALGKVAISDLRISDGYVAEFDHAAVKLNQSVAVSDRVPGFGAPTRIMSVEELERTRPDLCAVGSTTGLQCGEFFGLALEDSQGVFHVSGLDGDSGGAVFAVEADGAVVAVGTLVGTEKGSPDRTVVQLLDGSLPVGMSLGQI